MSILRPAVALLQPPDLRTLKHAMATIPQEADWRPEVLKLSRFRDDGEVQLVNRIHARVASLLGRNVEAASAESMRSLVADHFSTSLDEEHVTVNRTDRLRLQDAVFAEIVGYGPIQDLLHDDGISEIMVNGAHQVWIEREGKLYLTDVTFADTDHVIRVIQRIIAPLGRRCDEASPMVDARLPDGSRVNAVIPPLSLVGPVLTVRKFRREPLSPEELLRHSSITPEALQFLRACVLARIETMVLMSGADLPLRAIREQVAAAIDLVVYVERMQDGTRKITQISEVRGYEGDLITMQDLFVFQRDGFDGQRVLGSLRPTGIRPAFSEQLTSRGLELPLNWFGYDGDGAFEGERG